MTQGGNLGAREGESRTKKTLNQPHFLAHVLLKRCVANAIPLKIGQNVQTKGFKGQQAA